MKREKKRLKKRKKGRKRENTKKSKKKDRKEKKRYGGLLCRWAKGGFEDLWKNIHYTCNPLGENLTFYYCPSLGRAVIDFGSTCKVKTPGKLKKIYVFFLEKRFIQRYNLSG